MSPNTEKPTIEQLEKIIRDLSIRITENENKFRALLNHFNLYLDTEVIMRSYKVKKDFENDSCKLTGTAQSSQRE